MNGIRKDSFMIVSGYFWLFFDGTFASLVCHVQCSASCGVGIRKREVRCIESRQRGRDGQGRGRGKEVGAERCDGLDRPRDTEFCEQRECRKYQWRTGEWGEVGDPVS